jgi:glycosyltransferase involved in cell wall biosynthesis
MRLLLISRKDPFSTAAGTEIFVGNLAVELVKQGQQVDMIYEGKSNAKCIHSRSENLKEHRLRLIGIPYVRSFDFRRRCSKHCCELLKESRVDVVIAFGAGTFSGYIFKRIKRIQNRPLLIYYAMDSMMMEYERIKASSEAKGLLASFQRRIWYSALIRSDKTSCLNSDLILASSKDTADHLTSNCDVLPTRINLLYEGVPDDFADGINIIDPDIPTFLHIAGGPRKGTDFFLAAVKLLEAKYGLRAEAVIIRASQSNIKEAEALGVEAKAYKYISKLELKRLYASCSALVSSSLSEGFCLPVVEAAMFGKPSVVTDIGSLPELVSDGENGFVIPTADVNALADRMHQISINTKLRRTMGENAGKRAKNFTITSAASSLLTLVKEFKR